MKNYYARGLGKTAVDAAVKVATFSKVLQSLANAFIHIISPLPMINLTIEIPGAPQGKSAARTSRSGFSYTPKKTVNYMSDIKAFAAQAIKELEPNEQSLFPFEGGCYMTIDAYFPIPPSYTKKKKEAALNGELMYIKKPDTDNLSKMKDALTGVVFADDRQVVQEVISKMYSDRPRLEINIYYEPGA